MEVHDLLACVLCIEPFGHGGDLLVYYAYCVLSHLGMRYNLLVL